MTAELTPEPTPDDPSRPVDPAERLRQLFVHHYDPLCAYALRFGTGNLQDAEDAVQDAFLLLSAEHPVLLAPEPWRPLAYLYTTVRGHMMNGARDLALERRYLASHPDDIQAALGPIPFPTPLALLESAEWQARVQAALTALTPRSRQIVELRLAGLSYDEIADSLGIGRGTVNTHIVRAYRQLRQQLGGDEPPDEPPPDAPPSDDPPDDSPPAAP